MIVAVTGLAIGWLGPVAGAQGARAPLEVVERTFAHPDGTVSEVFEQGATVHGTLTLRNTGDVAVTGISATLTFERGEVSVASATWPDLGPGEQAGNLEPFVFRWHTIGQPDDASCFMILDAAGSVSTTEIVDELAANRVRLVDPALNPSDPFEPIPPGDLVWRIASDLGTVEFTIPFTAVCSVSTPGFGKGGDGSTVGGVLAQTGARTPWTAAIGAALVALGVSIRRRARAARA